MTRAHLVTNLRDPRVHARRTTEAVVMGVGTALVAPGRLPGPLVASMHGATALLGLFGGVHAAGPDAPLRLRAGFGVALGTVMLGTSLAGVAVDVRTERWLSARGATRPRWVMGGVMGGLTLAMLWLDDLAEESSPEGENSDDSQPGTSSLS